MCPNACLPLPNSSVAVRLDLDSYIAILLALQFMVAGLREGGWLAEGGPSICPILWVASTDLSIRLFWAYMQGHLSRMLRIGCGLNRVVELAQGSFY